VSNPNYEPANSATVTLSFRSDKEGLYLAPIIASEHVRAATQDGAYSARYMRPYDADQRVSHEAELGVHSEAPISCSPEANSGLALLMGILHDFHCTSIVHSSLASSLWIPKTSKQTIKQWSLLYRYPGAEGCHRQRAATMEPVEARLRKKCSWDPHLKRD
jgi:hypothetical protein